MAYDPDSVFPNCIFSSFVALSWKSNDCCQPKQLPRQTLQFHISRIIKNILCILWPQSVYVRWEPFSGYSKLIKKVNLGIERIFENRCWKSPDVVFHTAFWKTNISFFTIVKIKKILVDLLILMTQNSLHKKRCHIYKN